MSGPRRPLPRPPGDEDDPRGPDDEPVPDEEPVPGADLDDDDGLDDDAPGMEPGDTAQAPAGADDLETDILNDDLGPLVRDPSARADASDPNPDDEEADVTGTPLSDAEIDALAAAEDAGPGG